MKEVPYGIIFWVSLVFCSIMFSTWWLLSASELLKEWIEVNWDRVICMIYIDTTHVFCPSIIDSLLNLMLITTTRNTRPYPNLMVESDFDWDEDSFHASQWSRYEDCTNSTIRKLYVAICVLDSTRYSSQWKSGVISTETKIPSKKLWMSIVHESPDVSYRVLIG